jgi:hypothetical protein
MLKEYGGMDVCVSSYVLNLCTRIWLITRFMLRLLYRPRRITHQKRCHPLSLLQYRLENSINFPLLRVIRLDQWFLKCSPRLPRDPWVHFCNGYFEVGLLFS